MTGGRTECDDICWKLTKGSHNAGAHRQDGDDEAFGNSSSPSGSVLGAAVTTKHALGESPRAWVELATNGAACRVLIVMLWLEAMVASFRKGTASMNAYVPIVSAGLMIGLLFLACCSPGSDLPPLPAAPNTLSYQLGAGDRLAIRVLGADELTGEYLVQDDGTVRVLMIGKVPAAGGTSEQLETKIAQKLKAERYLTNPQVNVSVVSYRPFYILGEVTKPGGYPYASGMRVLSAVAAAQGYTYRANQDYVIITRDGEDKRADDLSSIQPDDIIRVPERYL
jgi:polysaccharide biosynthesis/export protein